MIIASTLIRNEFNRIKRKKCFGRCLVFPQKITNYTADIKIISAMKQQRKLH